MGSVMNEQMLKSAKSSDQEHDMHRAEVVKLADWQTVRDAAPQYVAERAPGLFELDASPEKADALRLLLKDFESTMKDEEADTNAKRQAYYASKLVAKELNDTNLVLSGERVMQHLERSYTPEVKPANYFGVAQVVPSDQRQKLSPSANDQLPPIGDLPALVRQVA